MDIHPDLIIERLGEYISENRSKRIESVLAHRTHTVVTVVEGLVNLGNVSAVMRSAEALGYYQFHVIENNDRFKHSERTSKGAEKWLDVHKWADAEQCASYLHEKGYQIVVTHLDAEAKPIDEIDFTRPTALVFGNERAGISEAMLSLADQRCIIPMVGFVESFNISVAAAVGLYHAYLDRVRKLGIDGDLSEEDKKTLRARYYYRSVKQADRILAG